jgi:hypothetical protein
MVLLRSWFLATVFFLVLVHQSKAGSSIGATGLNFFADSQSTYYEGYQQAWRYLGWYVKCGYPSDRYDEEQKGSHDKSKDNQEQRWQGNNYCQRYLIWAAVSGVVDISHAWLAHMLLFFSLCGSMWTKTIKAVASGNTVTTIHMLKAGTIRPVLFTEMVDVHRWIVT